MSSYLYECEKLAAAGDFGGTGPADGQLDFGLFPRRRGTVPFIHTVGCRILNTCTLTCKLQVAGAGNHQSLVLFSGSGQYGSAIGIRVPTLRAMPFDSFYRLQFSTNGKTTDGFIFCYWSWVLDEVIALRG
jgi:hypothetical protein